jgi:hypothetical protein
MSGRLARLADLSFRRRGRMVLDRRLPRFDLEPASLPAGAEERA